MKEYKGEEVAARLEARFMPPDDRYSDCMCQLVLTERHLYIFENDISIPLFTIFIERIRGMETQLKGVTYKQSVLSEMFMNGTHKLFAGITNSKEKEDSGIRFVITYDDGMGKRLKLYFKDLKSNANHFVKVYHEIMRGH